MERARRKPTESLDAYDRLLRAYAEFNLLTRDGNARAIGHLLEALKIDPGFANAAGLASWCYLFRRAQGWVEDAQKEAMEATRLARIVTDGDRLDPLAVAFAAQTYAFIDRDYEKAVGLVDHALTLNSNAFLIWTIDGWIRLYIHDYEHGRTSFQRAYRLNPLDPLAGTMMSGLSMAHWYLKEFDAALHWARKAVNANPNFGSSHAALVVALISLGRIQEGRDAAKVLMQIDPTTSLTRARTRTPFQKPELVADRIAALRVAGIPE